MSQLDFIKSHLEKYGEISRNTALANHITRLGAYACDLKRMGYDIKGEWRGKDYVYKWGKWTKPRQEVWLVKDGDRVIDTIRKEVTMKM